MILVVGNVKGGVAKTTLAINLSIALARAKRDILLIDGDEQGTALAFTDLRTNEREGPTTRPSPYAARISAHRRANSPASIRTS
jgi:cellulose biosynthesis protein BcsQ